MYEDLEAADNSSDDERQTTNNNGPTVARFKSKINTNYFGDEDETMSELSMNLGMKTTRFSDTRVPDDFSVSNPYASTHSSVSDTSVRSGTLNQSQAGTQFQTRRLAFHRANKRPRTEGHAAPGFLPTAPNKVEAGRAGFAFQKQTPNVPVATWNTIDPKTHKITRTDKSNENHQTSDNPHHPINDPLGALFGTTKVETAVNDRTVLTSENLDALNRELPTTGSGINGTPSDMAWSNNGSRPLGPSSTPSVKTIGSSDRYSQNDSVNSIMFEMESVDSCKTVWRPSTEIHDNIRANFITADQVLTHQGPKSNFEKTNEDWMSAPLHGINSSTVIVNKFSDDNVVKMETQAEMRIMDWDEHGNYRGEYQGAVKKRVRRGFIELFHKWQAEMIEASQAYRELLQMRPAERLAALIAMRKPMTQWSGRLGAAAADVFEAEAIPGIYKKKWDAKKARRERLQCIIQSNAIARSRGNASSRSGISQETNTTLSIVGRLGDMDGALPSTRAQHTVSGTQLSSRNSFPYLKNMSERAASAARSARQGGGKTARIRGNISVRPGSSSSTVTQSRVRIENFNGSTGYSVAEPRSATSHDDWPAFGTQPTKDRKNGIQHSSRATSSAINQGRNDTESIRTDFTALLEYDDSPLLENPVDVSFPYQEPLTAAEMDIQKEATHQGNTRGRAVVVRLHASVTFTGDALAKRVFGGIVQEFQLHPEQHSAVVIFAHPVEARSFVNHVRKVREHGTEQEIRELQIEAAWYNGHERDSIIAHNSNLMSHHIGLGATRALKIYNIDPRKLYKEVADDLGKRLGKLILFITLQSPIESHKIAIEGRIAIVEFASLHDAIDAYGSLSSGLEVGYENCNPEFAPERSSKQAQGKTYCNCLGCSDRKRKYEAKTAQKIRELREQRDNHGTARGTMSRSATAQPSLRVGNSMTQGSAHGSTSGVQGETEDTENDLLEFSDPEEDWGF